MLKRFLGRREMDRFWLWLSAVVQLLAVRVESLKSDTELE